MESENDTESKECRRCGEVKPLGEYHKKRTAPMGAAPWCKHCTAGYKKQRYRENRERTIAAVKKYRDNNPAAVRNSKLKSTHGIDLETYEAMFTRQHGRCAICGRTPEAAGHRNRHKGVLFVDHCHTSKAVRQLLCHGCNLALGHLGDSIPRLKAAIAYLEEHQSKNDNEISLA